MANWVERQDKRSRTSKTWQDTETGRLHVQSILGTALHYASTVDGAPDTPLDMTPVRVNNAALDGWVVTQNDWHYALGQPGDKATDGWVGFGGRRGAHWLKFRLARLGYLHYSTRAWQDVGGNPTYSRANLSQETQALSLGPSGAEETINAMSSATWAKLWQTPGGGTVSARWFAEGRRLKEEITVNAAARAWVTANRPPTTPLDETFFGLVFQMDVSDVPAWAKAGAAMDITDAADSDGARWEGQDALGRALFFMPMDALIVPGTRGPIPLRKRIWRDEDGQYYLLVGVRCDELVGLPAGDLIFDPTLNAQPAEATSKDSFIEAGGAATYNAGVGLSHYIGYDPTYLDRTLIQFDLTDLPSDATLTSTTLSLYCTADYASASSTVYIYRLKRAWVEGTRAYVADSPATGVTWNRYDTTNNWATAGGFGADDCEQTEIGSKALTATEAVNEFKAFSLSPTTKAALDLGNGWLLKVGAEAATNQYRYDSSNSSTAANRPKLAIEYDEASSDVTGTAALAGQPAAVAAAGTALLAITGAASIAGQPAEIASTGTYTPLGITGTGAVAGQPAAIAGTGEAVLGVTGTATLAAQPAEIAATGTYTPLGITGTGAIATQPAEVAATGTSVLAITGTASVAAQPAAIGGVGDSALLITGTGALVSQQAAIAATGAITFTGVGALEAQQAVIAGTGTSILAITSAGTITAQPATIEGTGTSVLAITGVGSIIVQVARIAGIGQVGAGPSVLARLSIADMARYSLGVGDAGRYAAGVADEALYELAIEDA